MANTTDTTNKELVNIPELSKELLLTKINNIRSNLQFLDYQLAPTKTPAPIKESFCHAFYRMLGLPVIDASAIKFYNPGYIGSDDNEDNSEERNNIDDNQDPVLTIYENLREVTCYHNKLAFDRQDPNYQYKLDLLQQRMTLDILDDNNNTFFDQGIDQQLQKLSKRKVYSPARKILRPFKCAPFISNNIFPITNCICAPFISESNSTVNSTKLQKSYLEFVLRTRMAKDTTQSSKNNLYTALQKEIKDFTLPSDIQKAISSFSDIENYITSKLFESLYYICKKTGEETKNLVKLVDQINARKDYIKGTNTSSFSLDTIELSIANKQAQIVALNLTLTAIPNYTIKDANGQNISFQNHMDCPLISPLIKLVQPSIEDLQKEIDQLNEEKQKKLKFFNNLDISTFYTIGEVNGLGLIDIISIMIAFWIIPKNVILSMLDKSSFIRMYSYPELRNEVVEQRHSITKDETLINIKDTMVTLDQTIVQILKSCEQVIKNNSV